MQTLWCRRDANRDSPVGCRYWVNVIRIDWKAWFRLCRVHTNRRWCVIFTTLLYRKTHVCMCLLTSGNQRNQPESQRAKENARNLPCVWACFMMHLHWSCFQIELWLFLFWSLFSPSTLYCQENPVLDTSASRDCGYKHPVLKHQPFFHAPSCLKVETNGTSTSAALSHWTPRSFNPLCRCLSTNGGKCVLATHSLAGSFCRENHSGARVSVRFSFKCTTPYWSCFDLIMSTHTLQRSVQSSKWCSKMNLSEPETAEEQDGNDETSPVSQNCLTSTQIRKLEPFVSS